MTNLKTTLKTALAVLLLMGLTGCGASDQNVKTTKAAKTAKANKHKPRWKQSRIVTQQEALCNRVCRRLTQCSVEYAEANLSTAVANQMSMPAGHTQQLNECHATRSECLLEKPTQKAANQTGQCLRENQECSALIACLN